VRILHVIGSLDPRHGDTSAVVPRACSALVARGHRVALLTTGPGRPLEATVDGVTLVRRRLLPPRGWATSPGLGRWLRRRVGEFDVVHVHGLHQFHGWWAARCCRRAKVPFVVSPHGALDRRRPGHRRMGGALRGAAAVHYASAAERERAAHRLGPAPAGFVVPPGVDRPPVRRLVDDGGLAARHPELAGRTLVCFLGRLTADHRLDLLIEAFAEVAAAEEAAHLAVAGPDEEGLGVELRASVARLGLEGRVSFLGPVTGPARAALLGRSRVLVLASEGLGVAAAEAMAAAIPVVVSEGRRPAPRGGGGRGRPGGPARCGPARRRRPALRRRRGAGRPLRRQRARPRLDAAELGPGGGRAGAHVPAGRRRGRAGGRRRGAARPRRAGTGPLPQLPADPGVGAGRLPVTVPAGTAQTRPGSASWPRTPGAARRRASTMAPDSPAAEERDPLTTAHVPLVDLRAAHERLRGELDAAVARVVEQGRFILGPEVAAFEAEFAAFCGARRAVGVGSGTAALHLALRALGVGPGDEVVTVAHTFAATAEAIGHAGARPRFVDVEEATGGMDPKALEGALDGAAAVVPVHLYGLPVDMAAVGALAAEAGVPVLEDAAQAHGAGAVPAPRTPPRRAGTLGRIAAFSFFPAKNLGAFGDAGAVTTDDDALADRVARLRDHGRVSKYEHAEEGFGERLDALQAAVLRVRLADLDAANATRARLAARYDQALAGAGDLVLPPRPEGRSSAWHLYVVRTAERDALLAHLRAAGVQAGVHYPLPLHLQPAWRHLGHARGDLPATEAWAAECLSLPLYPELGEAAQDRVAAAVRAFFAAPG
jgi:dTDP-4-amino-4,6-dideoxygalactose transaminase/glycosyltransferase involved in cell wall biosynthesis